MLLMRLSAFQLDRSTTESTEEEHREAQRIGQVMNDERGMPNFKIANCDSKLIVHHTSVITHQTSLASLCASVLLLRDLCG
jgi:hypothetical protein